MITCHGHCNMFHFVYIFQKSPPDKSSTFLRIYFHASPHKIKRRILVPTPKSLTSATLLLLILEIKITKLWAASYGTRSNQISLKSVTWLRDQATRQHYTSFLFQIRFVLHELVFKIPTVSHRLHHIHSFIHRKKKSKYPCAIRDGRSGTGRGLFPKTSVFISISPNH
jgi:hypothetical protein